MASTSASGQETAPFELGVELIADGRRAVIADLLQHIEEAGIH